MHKCLMLATQNSFDSLDDDTNSDLQMTHHRNTILDALDELELMEVDNDPNADQTDTDDDKSQELEILDSATGPVVPPKIPTPPPTVDISYMVSILSASEMKKAKSKREPVNTSIDLRTDEPWDTLKAQILVKISTAINPRMLHFDDYSLTYHISWVLPKPGLSLLTEADYNGMMKQVDGMAAKAPTVNINVIQTQPASNNNENQGEDESELAKSKMKKQKESAAILPGNKKKVANIQLLQDHWICKKTDSACASTHCYVIPGSEEHFPLGHQQLDCWASAMVDISSLAISPVLQCRLDAQAKTVTEPTSSTPVVNITFGNEFASLFKSSHTALNTTTSGIGPVPISTSSLIPPLRKPGNDMSIVAFCALYQLDDSITTKFASHSFKEAHLLRYVTFSDLKEMEFKFGEIAALRDAVERWSIPTSMA
ncbi:uncharacterized protein F5891DRAFT_984425 [Suillus fuscotomentosus]|uniref:Uncharacterized protein n=1 Tax=Suillus fuscotomentosus TaxID=1912939 RepID=A0AAD4DYI3_9AGAM|nr:uncharacterized protein F5891DRAFT_984425 [Suillus fuscotomentosus]KAG1895219.1 hypothetical protein F5891DRAFT_984425 [Suillus fuscotomentosus]